MTYVNWSKQHQSKANLFTLCQLAEYITIKLHAVTTNLWFCTMTRAKYSSTNDARPQADQKAFIQAYRNARL